MVNRQSPCRFTIYHLPFTPMSVVAAGACALLKNRLRRIEFFDRGLISQAILKSRLDEGGKEGMSFQRLRFVFGVELAADEPWVNVAREFRYLYELSVWRFAADDQACPLQRLAEFR